MPIVLKNIEPRVRSAVRHYWETLGTQADRQGAESGRADTGNRNAVTGGKQMDGFCDLLMGVLADNGITKPLIHRHSRLEIPGYFRPTKKWDMLISDLCRRSGHRVPRDSCDDAKPRSGGKNKAHGVSRGLEGFRESSRGAAKERE